jgi:hypothetical protein
MRVNLGLMYGHNQQKYGDLANHKVEVSVSSWATPQVTMGFNTKMLIHDLDDFGGTPMTKRTPPSSKLNLFWILGVARVDGYQFYTYGMWSC